MPSDRLAGLRIVALLAAMTALSQFFRVSNGVIAPELVRDLDLSAEMLGLAGSAFFIALTVMQIPVGMMFDRFGVRRTVGWLTALAVLGALVNAVAETGAMLFAARFVIGIGCAGNFMGAVLVTSRWFSGERYTMVLSWIFALSQIGVLMGATPLAAASEFYGWRAAFVIAALITALAGVLFVILVRDRAPGDEFGASAPESVAQILSGIVEVWRIPGLLRVFTMHLFVYASMVTVLGIWAGPYLHDVHGLAALARGNVLLAMGAAQVAGILAYGPMDRMFNSRKRVVIAGTLATLTVFALLAAIPKPPVWLAALLLVLLCFVTAYGIVVVAHGRSLFPDRLAGRGVTTVNLAQAIGSVVLPIATGVIVGAFPATGGAAGAAAPEIAYRLAFAFIGCMLALCLLVYLGAEDSKPRGD